MCVSVEVESQIILQSDQNALELKIEKACFLSQKYPQPYYELPNLSPFYNHKIHTKRHIEKIIATSRYGQGPPSDHH